MIKVFRKLRHNFLETGKTTKYLKYAIGEIVLVVIGILIALSINNWNNSRELKTQNKQFLKKMEIELNQNRNRIEYAILNGIKDRPGLVKASKACDSLLKITYDGLDEKSLHYLLSAQIYAGGTALALNTSTYEELLNTGKLYTLGTDELVTAISSYYKLCERETMYQEKNAEFLEETFDKLQQNFLKLRMDYEMDSINFNIINYPYYFEKSSKQYQDLQTNLYKMKIKYKHDLEKAKLLINSTNSLIDKIALALNASYND